MITSLNKSVSVLDHDVQLLNKRKDALTQDNSELQAKINEYEKERELGSNATQSSLEDKLNHCEMQLKLFRNNVEKLMAQNSALESNLPVYIPRKLDKIDIAIAEFVNCIDQR